MNAIKHRLWMAGLWTLVCVASVLYFVGAAILTVGDFVFSMGDSVRELALAIIRERTSKF